MPITRQSPDDVLAAFAASGMFPVGDGPPVRMPGGETERTVKQSLTVQPTEDGWTRIPVPPSANGIWRSVAMAGRVKVLKSWGYRTWLKLADTALRLEMEAVRGPVSVMIRVGGKRFNRQRDLDNTIKPIIDALRHADRIEGDSVKTVRSIYAGFLDDGEQRCEVRVVRIELQ